MSHWFSFTLLTGKSGKCRFQRLQFIISRLLRKGNNQCKVKAPSIFTINAWCVFRMQPAAANADARLQLHSCSTETHFQWWSIVFCSCLLLFLELLFYQGILKPQKWPSPKWASHSRYRVKCNQELTAAPNLDLTPQKDHCGPPRTFRNVFSGPRYLAFTRTHTHKHTLLHTLYRWVSGLDPAWTATQVWSSALLLRLSCTISDLSAQSVEAMTDEAFCSKSLFISSELGLCHRISCRHLDETLDRNITLRPLNKTSRHAGTAKHHVWQWMLMWAQKGATWPLSEFRVH